jgi:peptidoglycan/xylan/chitin deacetylase (PgdA/CDA1 family)
MPLSKREKIWIRIWVTVFVLGACFFAFKAYTLKLETEEILIQQAQIKSELLKAEMKPVKQNIYLYQMNKNSDLIPKNPQGPTNVVLLTIDDGPTKRSQKMMDVLDKHHAKAIFFINGMHVKNDQVDTLKEEARRGNAVGNHTWSHPNLEHATDVNMKHEIDSNMKIIEKETGTPPRFFRPPYGLSTKAVREYVKVNGMIYMNWTGSVKDWEPSAKEKDVFIENVLKDLHPGEIILLHEHPWSAEYLDELLTAIEGKGYTFLDPKNIAE